MIGWIVFFLVVWFIVSIPIALNTPREKTWEQACARGLIWPFVFPVIATKQLFCFGKFIVKVISEIPDAISDTWGWK